jgi:hypothetical protein
MQAMRLAIMQPYFFPYLGYFQLLAAADKFILHDNLNYIKEGWMHRNRLRPKGQGAIYCSVPVVGASSFVKIREVQIDYRRPWPGKFLNLVGFIYRKAPYFAETYPVIVEAVTRPATHLTEVNRHTISALAAHLAIGTAITSDTAPYQPFEDAVREEHSELLARLRAQTQVTDIKTLRALYICDYERADTLLNAIGGQRLYCREHFTQNHVTLQFVQPTLTPYRQFSRPFIAGLSIIDVLMHCGREETRRRLYEYTLV